MICGVELVVQEFDIERSPSCGEAYLELAGRRYCGSLDRGVQSEYEPSSIILRSVLLNISVSEAR